MKIDMLEARIERVAKTARIAKIVRKGEFTKNIFMQISFNEMRVKTGKIIMWQLSLCTYKLLETKFNNVYFILVQN